MLFSLGRFLHEEAFILRIRIKSKFLKLKLMLRKCQFLEEKNVIMLLYNLVLLHVQVVVFLLFSFYTKQSEIIEKKRKDTFVSTLA